MSVLYPVPRPAPVPVPLPRQQVQVFLPAAAPVSIELPPLVMAPQIPPGWRP